jgi:hypothetical protein
MMIDFISFYIFFGQIINKKNLDKVYIFSLYKLYKLIRKTYVIGKRIKQLSTTKNYSSHRQKIFSRLF